MNNTPYTYLIGWTILNKWYYGVRYAKNCCPTDLWNPYKTSSRIVANFIKLYGEPDVCIVRKTFNSIDKARLWEQKVLTRLCVTDSKKWLNGHDTKAFDPSLVPKGDDHWTRKDPDKWKEVCNMPRVVPAGDRHWTRQNKDAAEKHKIRMLGDSNPNNFLHNKNIRSNKLKIENPVNIPGVREKIKESLTGYKHPRKICEHCKKDVADSIYTRWHGSKCKKNNKID